MLNLLIFLTILYILVRVKKEYDNNFIKLLIVISVIFYIYIEYTSYEYFTIGAVNLGPVLDLLRSTGEDGPLKSKLKSSTSAEGYTQAIIELIKANDKIIELLGADILELSSEEIFILNKVKQEKNEIISDMKASGFSDKFPPKEGLAWELRGKLGDDPSRAQWEAIAVEPLIGGGGALGVLDRELRGDGAPRRRNPPPPGPSPLRQELDSQRLEIAKKEEEINILLEELTDRDEAQAKYNSELELLKQKHAELEKKTSGQSGKQEEIRKLKSRIEEKERLITALTLIPVERGLEVKIKQLEADKEKFIINSGVDKATIEKYRKANSIQLEKMKTHHINILEKDAIIKEKQDRIDELNEESSRLLIKNEELERLKNQQLEKAETEYKATIRGLESELKDAVEALDEWAMPRRENNQNEIIKKLEEEALNYKIKLAKIEATVDVRISEEVDNRRIALDIELIETKKSLDNSETELITLRLTNSDLSRELEAEKGRYADLRTEKNANAAEMNTLRAKYESNIKKLESEVEKKLKVNKRLKKTNLVIADSLTAMTKKEKEANDKFRKKNQEFMLLLSQKNMTEEYLEKHNTQIDEIRTEQTQIEADKIVLENTNEQLKIENKKLQEDITGKDKKIEELEEDRSKDKLKITELRLELKGINLANAEAEKSKKQHEADLDKLRKEMEQLRDQKDSKIDTLQNDMISKKEAEILKKEQELLKSNQIIEELLESLQNTESELIIKNIKVAELEIEVKLKSDKIVEQSEKIKSLELNNNKQVKEIDELSEKLDNIAREKDRAIEQIETKMRTNTINAEQFERLEIEKQKIETEAIEESKMLQIQVDSLLNKLEQKQSVIDSLSKELREKTSLTDQVNKVMGEDEIRENTARAILHMQRQATESALNSKTGRRIMMNRLFNQVKKIGKKSLGVAKSIGKRFKNQNNFANKQQTINPEFINPLKRNNNYNNNYINNYNNNSNKGNNKGNNIITINSLRREFDSKTQNEKNFGQFGKLGNNNEGNNNERNNNERNNNERNNVNTPRQVRKPGFIVNPLLSNTPGQDVNEQDLYLNVEQAIRNNKEEQIKREELTRRSEINNLYGQHNPDQLREVNVLIKKFGDVKLLSMMKKKYGPQIRRSEIDKMYEQYNPDKLNKVNGLIDKYGDKKLLKMLERKYSDDIKADSLYNENLGTANNERNNNNKSTNRQFGTGPVLNSTRSLYNENLERAKNEGERKRQKSYSPKQGRMRVKKGGRY